MAQSPGSFCLVGSYLECSRVQVLVSGAEPGCCIKEGFLAEVHLVVHYLVLRSLHFRALLCVLLLHDGLNCSLSLCLNRVNFIPRGTNLAKKGLLLLGAYLQACRRDASSFQKLALKCSCHGAAVITAQQ